MFVVFNHVLQQLYPISDKNIIIICIIASINCSLLFIERMKSRSVYICFDIRRSRTSCISFSLSFGVVSQSIYGTDCKVSRDIYPATQLLITPPQNRNFFVTYILRTK